MASGFEQEASMISAEKINKMEDREERKLDLKQIKNLK
jgi:hypothetical protein